MSTQKSFLNFSQVSMNKQFTIQLTLHIGQCPSLRSLEEERKQQQSAAEGVEEVVSRLIANFKSCTQIEDRRNCIQNIAGYAKKFPRIVASHGFTLYFGNLGIQDNFLLLGTLETIELLLKEPESCTNFVETLEKDGNFQVFTALIQQPNANEEQAVTEAILRILTSISKVECPRLCQMLMQDGAKTLGSMTGLVKSENDVVLIHSCTFG